MADNKFQGEQKDHDYLRVEFYSQTATVLWKNLQPQFAKGIVVEIALGLDLVEVATQLSLDNNHQFQTWIAEKKVARVTDETAQRWFDSNKELWTVVAPPWVLVQMTEPDLSS